MASVDDTKDASAHKEYVSPEMNENAITGFVTHTDDVAPNYFRSKFFLGSMAAICLSLDAGVAGFSYAAPLITTINQDIGPDPNIGWVSLTYTLSSTVCLTAIGRIGDVFGRRNLLIGGTALALIGSIICAAAQNISMLIGGMTLIGVGASTQLSYFYVMGEILPMKYRLLGNGVVYMSQLITGGFTAVIGQAFMIYTPKTSWRGVFFIVIGLNAAALVCWILFYHPPRFHMKHGNDKKSTYIKRFDYIGLVLFTGGLLMLLFGLSWGGETYPWKSAHVVATIVVGVITLIAFGLWEVFMDLKEPLVLVHIFQNGAWLNATALSGIGISMYYAFAIVWPDMVAILYTDGTVTMSSAWLKTILGLGMILGEIAGGFIGKPLGKLKWQCIVTFIIGGIFFACTATCGPDDKVRACVFVAIGVFFEGWAESLSVTMVTLTIKKQDELGGASGMAGSIRFLISTIANIIYTVILNNKLDSTVGPKVTSAVESAGLPESSVAQFIAALPDGTSALKAVPGVTNAILDAGVKAYKDASASAYSIVFLTTIAFTVVGVICALMLPDIDKLLTGQMAVIIEKESKPVKEKKDIESSV